MNLSSRKLSQAGDVRAMLYFGIDKTELVRVMFNRFIAVWVFIVGFASASAGTDAIEYIEQSVTVDSAPHAVRVPRGLRFEVLNTTLDEPRMLTFAANGDLFIGSKSGNVYRLAPPYTNAQVVVKLSGYPHSVALRDGAMLIARTDGVYRAPYVLGQATIAPKEVTLLAALPGGGGHNSRSVAVGPDGRVYVSLGISGNCSDQFLGDGYPFDDRRGGVLRLREDAAHASWETYASGLRNPVGFAWHPVTKDLYASNNGPDHWGFDEPAEYFSRLTAGSFHGMPWFQYVGNKIVRDDCIKRAPPRAQQDVIPPVAAFPARNAPMGVAFVPQGGLVGALELDAVVALRGSWGTQPSGGFLGAAATRRHPKLVVVRFKDGAAQRVDDLVTGFQLNDGERWARPVGVAAGPDGAIYFTSDSGVNGLFRLRRDKAPH